MAFYSTKHQAEKNRKKGEEIIVEVACGYVVMSYADYYIWRNLK